MSDQSPEQIAIELEQRAVSYERLAAMEDNEHPAPDGFCSAAGGDASRRTAAVMKQAAVLLRRLHQAEWDVHNLKREVAGKSCIQCGGSIDLEKGRCLECDEQETATNRELESLRAEVARLQQQGS